MVIRHLAAVEHDLLLRVREEPMTRGESMQDQAVTAHERRSNSLASADACIARAPQTMKRRVLATRPLSLLANAGLLSAHLLLVRTRLLEVKPERVTTLSSPSPSPSPSRSLSPSAKLCRRSPSQSSLLAPEPEPNRARASS